MQEEKKGRDEIVGILASNKVVEEIVGNITEIGDDEQDLIQDLYLDLLGKDEDLIQQLYYENSLNFYISRMVVNNIKSKTSPFYYRYKKRKNHLDIKDYTNIPDDSTKY